VFLLTVSALFPIVDPLAGTPFFLAMTERYPPEIRRSLAWRVAVNSLVLMVGSYFIGAHVLDFFGVSLPVVQVGGGLVVVAMGWNTLVQGENTQQESRQSVQCSDALHSAFYPLTLPRPWGPERFRLRSPSARTQPADMDSTSSLFSRRSLR
jgi:multiple antibiotic resistance protein